MQIADDLRCARNQGVIVRKSHSFLSAPHNFVSQDNKKIEARKSSPFATKNRVTGCKYSYFKARRAATPAHFQSWPDVFD